MDMSMRSSGLIAMTPRDEIIGLDIIKTSLDEYPDHEDTIIQVIDVTMDFIAEVSADAFVIEGLSHGAKSAHKDVIAGIFWGIRVAIWRKFKIPIGVVPVTSWRSKVLNKEDRKYAKENYSPKADAIKIATVNKLPKDIHKYFINYIEGMHLPKKSVYDLADAYFLGIYRNSLDAKD
jgi:hypothetical protein